MSKRDVKLSSKASMLEKQPPGREHVVKRNAFPKRKGPLALFLMPDPAGAQLRGICNRLGVETVEADCCNEARRLLADQPRIDLLFTAMTLPDGNWCDVLRFVVDQGIDVAVLLGCTAADERLWSEALWRGVYDLVVEPYDESEVRRIVEGALRSRQYYRLQRAARS